VGTYSYVDWARRLVEMPVQVLPLAMSLVVYPYLSEWATQGEREKMRLAFIGTTRAMMFLFVPAAVALILLSLPTVWLVYGGEEFNLHHDAPMTSHALRIYSAGMPFFAMEGIINKWFFALTDTFTPNIAGALMGMLHVLIAWGGLRLFKKDVSKLGAVAWALTVSKGLKVVWLYASLHGKIGRFFDKSFFSFCLKLAVAVAAMVGAMQGSSAAIHSALEIEMASKKDAAILFLGSAAAGTVAFLAAAFLLRIEELRMVLDEGQKKLKSLLSKARR
jgi:putative peptidoglycan lipid II flippase